MKPDELARLHALAFTDVPRPWTRAEFARMLAEPATTLITEAGGFILGRAAGGEAELLTLAVDPAMRRRGVGLRLVEALCATLGRNAGEMFLEVVETNGPALALYEAAGFRQTGRRPGYYRRKDGGRVDALVMAKALNATADSPKTC